MAGSLIFFLTTLVGGLLFPEYSHIHQYISESYAADAEFGFQLRWLGFIPSGILFCLFFIFNYRYLNQTIYSKLGTLGFFVLYGIGTILCGIFYCDAGCLPEEPSNSQIIHNLLGGLLYLCLPLLYLLIYKGLGTQNQTLKRLTFFNFISGIILIILFFKFFDSDFKGLLQRVIEGMLLIWICVMDLNLKSKIN